MTDRSKRNITPPLCPFCLTEKYVSSSTLRDNMWYCCRCGNWWEMERRIQAQQENSSSKQQGGGSSQQRIEQVIKELEKLANEEERLKKESKTNEPWMGHAYANSAYLKAIAILRGDQHE